MKNPNLQLLVRGVNVSQYDVSVNHEGVKVEGIVITDNPDYLFVTLQIEKGTKAGSFDLIFSEKGKKRASYSYELKDRKADFRAYVVAGEDVKVWNCGLTRYALEEGNYLVNSSQGGGFKDTWVMEL